MSDQVERTVNQVSEQLVFGRAAEARGIGKRGLRAHDYLPLQTSLRLLQHEAQHVGRVGVAQELTVQPGEGRVVNPGDADPRLRDCRVPEDRDNRPPDPPAVDRQPLLAIGDGDGDQSG